MLQTWLLGDRASLDRLLAAPATVTATVAMFWLGGLELSPVPTPALRTPKRRSVGVHCWLPSIVADTKVVPTVTTAATGELVVGWGGWSRRV